jgi:HEAT repeat protein
MAFLAVGAVIGSARGQEEDPPIGGRPLSELVKQLRSETKGIQLRAAKALVEAPAELRPKMMPRMMELLKSDRENDKYVAAQVLGGCGPAARAAIPDLLPMLDGTQYERNRAAAAKALGLILKDAKPDEEVEKVTKALIAVFEDKYSDVRREAVTACGMIGPAAKSCIPHLPRRLVDRSLVPHPWIEQNERMLVERAAVWTAGQMGGLAACHMDRLVGMVHGDLGADVSEAIGKIGATQDNVVPNLMALVERGNYWDNPAAKEKAFEAMEAFGPKAAPAAPLLDRFLRERTFHGATGNPLRILKVMKGIGPAAKPYEATLKGYVDLKEYPGVNGEGLAEMRKAASAALEAIGAKASAPASEEKESK